MIGNFVVHTRSSFAEIREAETEIQQGWKFTRFIQSRRQTYLMNCSPKAIAGMRVVMTHGG